MDSNDNGQRPRSFLYRDIRQDHQPGQRLQSPARGQRSVDSPQKVSRIPTCQQYQTFQLVGNKIGEQKQKTQNTQNLENEPPCDDEKAYINERNNVRAAERFQTAMMRNDVLNYKDTVKLLDNANKLYRKQCAQESSVAPQTALGMCTVSDNIFKAQHQKTLKQKLENVKFQNIKLPKEHAIEDTVGYQDKIESLFPVSKLASEETQPVEDSGFDSHAKSCSLESPVNERLPEDVFNTAYLESSPQQRSASESQDTIVHRSVEMVDVGIQVEPIMCSKSIQVQSTNFLQLDEPDRELLKPTERTPLQEKRNIFQSIPTPIYADTRPKEVDLYIKSPRTTSFTKYRLSDTSKFVPHPTSSPKFPFLYDSPEDNVNKVQRHLQSPSMREHISGKDSVPFFPPLSEVVPPSTPLAPYLKRLASEYLSSENSSKTAPEQAVPLSEPIRERHIEEIPSSPALSTFSSSSGGSLTAANIVRSLHKDYQAKLSIGKAVKNAMAGTDGACSDGKLVKSFSSDSVFSSRLGDISTTSLDVNLSDPNISTSMTSQSENVLSPEQFFELKKKKLEILEQVVKRRLHLPSAPIVSVSEATDVLSKEIPQPNQHFYHELSTISEVDSEFANAENSLITTGNEVKVSEFSCVDKPSKDTAIRDRLDGISGQNNVPSMSSSAHPREFQESSYHSNSLRKFDRITSNSSDNILISAAYDMSKSLLQDPSFCLLSPLSDLTSSSSDQNVRSSDSPTVSTQDSSTLTSQQTVAVKKVKSDQINVVAGTSTGNEFFALGKNVLSGSSPAQTVAVKKVKSDQTNVVTGTSTGNEFFALGKNVSSGSSPASNSYLRKLLSRHIPDSPNISNLTQSESNYSPSTFLSRFTNSRPTSFQEDSTSSSAFQPLTFVSDDANSTLPGSSRNVPSVSSESDIGASNSPNQQPLSAIRAVKPSSVDEETLFKRPLSVPTRLEQKESVEKPFSIDKISQVSGTSSSSHQYEGNSVSSGSDSSRYESSFRVKRTRSSKFFNQRFGKKMQEAEKRQYSGSSDEQLSQIFTKTDMFCQSTPMKQNDDMIQGITDEPDLTLIGPEVSLAMRAEISSNETVTSNENRNEADVTSSNGAVTSEGNTSGLSQSMISFLEHEKSALTATDDNGSFMCLTYQPSSNDEVKSTNSKS